MGAKGRGNQAFQKCGQSAYFADDGWSAVACENDPEYGCRRPYIILISDGEDVCKGEDATADVSDMKSFTGVNTWALNLGEEKHCQSGGGLHSIVTPANGECVNVSSKEELKDTLAEILGQIREEARAFATAAVPTVQTTSDQAIYVSSFTPLNEKSVWDGHLNAFLKPIPLSDDSTPQTGTPCGNGVEAGCLLWDAGEALLSQITPADFLGNGMTQRRVGYARDESGDAVPRSMRLFDPIDCSDSDSAFFDDCTDLLDAMGIVYDEASPASMQWAQTQANQVVQTTLAKKQHTPTEPDGSDGDTFEYVLGDIFHSNPVVIGSPANISYFATDLHGDGSECKRDGTGNPGYRCFFENQRFRRKVLVVGSNDGMLHAFDAGRSRRADRSEDRTESRQRVRQRHRPRAVRDHSRDVLPTVRTIANGTKQHYTTDGSPMVADVFIDRSTTGRPIPTTHSGAPSPSPASAAAARRTTRSTSPSPTPWEAGSGGETVPSDNGAANRVPKCISSYSAGTCGPIPYASMLWEIHDDSRDVMTPLGFVLPPDAIPMDEDQNLVPDLGDTWSTANVGRIRLCSAGGTKCRPDPVDEGDDDDLVERHVAVFGGGLDPEADHKAFPVAARDFLYIADIETGKIIYKRRLCAPHAVDQDPVTCPSAGSAAAPPAAIDSNQDGYFDRIYQTTTGGYVFRVDLGVMSDGRLPALVGEPVIALDPALRDLGDPNISPHVTLTAMRVPRIGPDGSELWQPRAIFDANWDQQLEGDVVAAVHPRQIYHAPSVFFDARLGIFGLGIGTGNREDLWEQQSQPERFYVFLDDTDEIAPSELPLDEGHLQLILQDDPNFEYDLLMTRAPGQRGWFIALEEDERTITEAFAVSGITIFSAFSPETAITSDPDCDPLAEDCADVELACGEKQFESSTDNLCARAGFSKNFVVGTTNGDGFLTSSEGTPSRYDAVSTFVTSPFTEPGQNRTSIPATREATPPTPSPIRRSTSWKGSRACSRRAAASPTTASTSRLSPPTPASSAIAPIPVCIIEKNWKEY